MRLFIIYVIKFTLWKMLFRKGCETEVSTLGPQPPSAPRHFPTMRKVHNVTRQFLSTT